MSGKSLYRKIIETLNENNIEYKKYEHEAVRTSKQAAQIRGEDLSTGAKAMVLKAEDDYIMVVLPADRLVDWRKLKDYLGIKNVRFAKIPKVEELTGAKVGGIPPFGNLVGLDTFFDSMLLGKDRVNFNAGKKTVSINMRSQDLVDLIKPDILDLSKENNQ